MKKMRMKVLALCFSMTLTVSALAGNGRLTIQAATSQESSGTKETTEKDSTTSADTAENKNQIIEIADEKAFEDKCNEEIKDSYSPEQKEYLKSAIKDEMQYAETVPFLLANNTFKEGETVSFDAFMNPTEE